MRRTECSQDIPQQNGPRGALEIMSRSRRDSMISQLFVLVTRFFSNKPVSQHVASMAGSGQMFGTRPPGKRVRLKRINH